MLYTIAIQFYVKYYSYTTSLLYYTRYPVLVKEVTDNIYCISFRTQCPLDQYIRRVVKHITCAISMSSRIEEVKDCIHITLICGSLSIVWHIPDYIEMQCCELDIPNKNVTEILLKVVLNTITQTNLYIT
jgi:hypothetical protein